MREFEYGVVSSGRKVCRVLSRGSKIIYVGTLNQLIGSSVVGESQGP